MDRFWSKVNICGIDECWDWLAHTNNKGYGGFGLNGKMCKAHRVAWYLTYGEFPELCVLHKCDNRRCVNLNHLFLGTNTDNIADKVQKGRAQRMLGESHPRAKLTEGQVVEIRHLLQLGVTQAAVVKMYHIHPATVSHIYNGRIWRHLIHD